ncbi:MAG: 50S ribosomal protein L3 [Patescibacteria group bacterium]
MLTDFYATKLGMTQAWTKSGKRLAITRCQAADLPVLANLSELNKNATADSAAQTQTIEIGVVQKKLRNMSKPLRTRLEKSGFSFGVRSMRGVTMQTPQDAEVAIKAGSSISVDQVLAIGDVVDVQGLSKGRGFAGAIKRHGFHGGPKTHGQSDRHRSVGSIGAGTTPGKVIKGKKMPGHYGAATQTVKSLTIVHIDTVNKEVWLSGPVPGALFSPVRIRKTGQSRTITIDQSASGITTPAAEATEKVTTEAATA